MGRLYTYSSEFRSHNFGSMDLPGATITKEFSQWHSMRTVRMDAHHFMRAYTLLKNDNQRSMVGSFSTAGHADVVNLAFALELFLKSLLYGVGIKPTQSHNLKKLFEKLPADLQQNIRLNFNARFSRVPFKAIFQPIDFDELLEMHANAYQNWRYLFESGYGSFNYQFCETLADILAELVEQGEKQLQAIVAKQYENGEIKGIVLV